MPKCYLELGTSWNETVEFPAMATPILKTSKQLANRDRNQ